LRLDLQGGSRGGGLLDHGGVFLRGPLDIGHRVVHGRNAHGLLRRGV